MRLSDFDYQLPAGLIAQHPAAPRESARMLVLGREGHTREDRTFRELPELLRGDELVVVNNTKVIPARLFGLRAGVTAGRAGRGRRTQKEHLSAKIEILLTRQTGESTWNALVRPGRKVLVGERIVIAQGELEAEVIGRGELGLRELKFECSGKLLEEIFRLGHVPLPPYIGRADEATDRTDYETVFARRVGAVAAPTAGLHFTPLIVEQLRARGIELCEVTLHVGLGTFQPIHVEEIEQHRMHEEWYEVSDRAAERIRLAKGERRPVLAVGTTVVRALEDAAQRAEGIGTEGIGAVAGDAGIFIRPGHRFRVVDQLLTNFHLPRSTLLVLVSAFAGREFLLEAYQHAVHNRYRFYSYGDCMLIR